MTQANESLGLTAAEHIRALNRHAQAQLFDYALINRTPASEDLKAKYALEGAAQIVADLEAIEQLGCCPVLGDYLDEAGAARHATEVVARDILDIAAQSTRCFEEASPGLRPHSLDSACADFQHPLLNRSKRFLCASVSSVVLSFFLASRYIESECPSRKLHASRSPSWRPAKEHGSSRNILRFCMRSAASHCWRMLSRRRRGRSSRRRVRHHRA